MASFDLHDVFKRALLNGDAYRASNRTTLDDGEEFIVHFSPSSDGGTFHVETPAISPDAAADIDVWENADPEGNTTGGLLVHNMNYGVAEADGEIQTVVVEYSGEDVEEIVRYEVEVLEVERA